MSTNTTRARGPLPEAGLREASGQAVGFDLDAAWELGPLVSVRPERFGGLLYHFGTRRLSFVKDPALLRVVGSLAEAATARSACARAGVPDGDLPRFQAALATLASSDLIRRREAR